MTTSAHGPYEHAGAYANLAEFERFDTSGTSNSFCPSCEHDPCVAEHRKYPRPGACAETPRQLSVGRVTEPIHSAGRLLDGPAQEVYDAMELAVHALHAFAITHPIPGHGDLALGYLVKIRDDMRRVVSR